MDHPPAPRLNILRTLKIGTFHIGSAFVDLLTSGVLNRVLITDLGIWATPVALLSALRYLLAPLSIWAGYRSDTHPLFGMHRLPYIWLGRVLMLLSLLLLPVVTVILAANQISVLGWVLATLAFLIYGVGTLISGSTYLALVSDSAPPTKRGIAVTIVQIFLLVSFPISAIVYGKMMPTYDPAIFWKVVLTGIVIAAIFFFFSIFGEERPGQVTVTGDPQDQIPFTTLLRQMWADRRTRMFFLFLSLGAISAFAQDAVLEPFGGDVFKMEIGETTRLNAYWGVGALVGLIGTVIITRKRIAHEQSGTALLGLILTAVPFIMLAFVAISVTRWLLLPALVFFGLGYGVYTAGALSLMMAMTSDQRAGAYLGLWSVSQLVFRGVGIFLGGAIHDTAILLGASAPLAYASVFFLEAVGMLACITLLIQADVPGFVRSTGAQAMPAASLAAVDM
ncbi:MAG: BCD family MFS transporter [Chloroflexales bacterium]